MAEVSKKSTAMVKEKGKVDCLVLAYLVALTQTLALQFPKTAKLSEDKHSLIRVLHLLQHLFLSDM